MLCMNRRYSSDLDGAEWEYVQQHIPSESSRGRPRPHPLREMLHAIFYVLRTSWRPLLFTSSLSMPLKLCSIMFEAIVLKVLGRSCFEPFTEQNAQGKEEIPTQRGWDSRGQELAQ
jgi:hypothetical protein